MVSIRNIEKYLNDHPELWAIRESIMKRARQYAEPNSGIISGGAVTRFILGEIAKDFFNEILSEDLHRQMFNEDVKKLTNSP